MAAAVHAPPGLSSTQARDRLAEHGPNSVAEPTRPHVAPRVLAQLRDPMILLLLAAAALTISLGDWTDTAVIALVVVLNTGVGVAQEVRAEHAVDALRALTAPAARVRRDGRDRLVPSAEVVPDDVLRLEAGDIVPADARLLDAVTLQVDESTLTGESVPVEKGTGPPPDELLGGTVVTRGRATALVLRTGRHSALGSVAALVAAERPKPTPLQQRLAELGRALAAIAVGLSGLVLLLGVLRGEDLAAMTVTAASLAVAAVPESLPAVVTLALALGARRMAHRAALVRRLPAVETLGAVSVLATDKTGTLTQNRMVAQRVYVGGARYDATGAGYAPDGSLEGPLGADGPGAGDPATRDELAGLLRDVVLCNDAELARGSDGEWHAVGDPMEAALLVLAARGGVAADDARAAAPRVAEQPFDSTRRRMTTVHDHPLGRLVVCKGAPEAVLRPHLLAEPTARITEARAQADRLAADGFRVLAVADRLAPPGPLVAERDLRLAGLVAIADPPRDDAAAAVGALRSAGIDLLLITGDHPATGSSVAHQVGITDHPGSGDVVVTGDRLDRGLTDAALAAARVFARTRPEQKLDIIRSWQSRGQVVAMTGDGVNDAPALRAADIGVAMGRGGTEVARQAADLVLTDDSLATVVVAVEEGRRIYDNVRRFLRYALSGGAAEVLVMLLGPFLGLTVPLLPAQILWVNLLTHGLPGVALGAEPADPGTMRRRPRPPSQSVLGGGLARQVLLTGAVIAATTLAAALLVRDGGGPWQSAAFLVLGLAQLGVALALHQRGTGERSTFLALTVAGAVALQVAGVWLPPLQGLLGTEALAAGQAAWCLGLATVPGLVVALQRRREQETAP